MEKAYCMKCRAKRDMKNPKTVTKAGRKFAVSTCPKCGTKMYRMGKG